MGTRLLAALIGATPGIDSDLPHPTIAWQVYKAVTEYGQMAFCPPSQLPRLACLHWPNQFRPQVDNAQLRGDGPSYGE